MGHEELCTVSHYADKHYIKHAPLPTPFPTATLADVNDDRANRLDKMKSALLHPRRRRHGTRRTPTTACNASIPVTAAAVSTAVNNEASQTDENKFIQQPIHMQSKSLDNIAPTSESFAAAIYTTVEREGNAAAADAAYRPASRQHLVHEFLLDGSAQLNGETLSGYPIYGHRTAEERLQALREALYHGSWQASEQLPSKLVRAVNEHGGCLRHTGVENEVVAPETREQYWRRLARHYISRHAEAAVVTETGGQPEDPFYVIDLGRVVEQMALWRHCLPMVRPHFAVKCNPNPAIIEVLAACGAGFDCASKAEIDLILKGGKKGPGSLVDGPDDIIFANPCKQPGDLKAAAVAGVTYVTFDSVNELEKIARYMPNAKAVLRIRTNDAKAVCQFSVKFGAPLEEVDTLLDAARYLNVEIYGVSFHVGSGNGDADAYTAAVRDAHHVFQLAARKGFNCTLLDLGGGYPGVTPTPEERAKGALSFEEIAAAMRPVLEELFPSEDTTIIAEPGRYFTAATHALVMNVFAARRLRISANERATCKRDFAEMVKERRAWRRARAGQHGNDDSDCESDGDADDNDEASPLIDLDDAEEYQYYVNDGLYGSFNCIIFDHAAPQLLLLNDGDGADADTLSRAGHNEENAPPNHDTVATTNTTVVTTVTSANDADLTSPASTNPGVLSYDTANVTTLTNAEQREVMERRRNEAKRPLRVTTIYGPTCDSMDCILKKKPFPEMRIGDWLMVPDMGSYTTAAGCAFNGFLTYRREWVCSISI